MLQIQRCPWCGTPIAAAQRASRRRPSGGSTSTAATSSADCPFAQGGEVGEGLPVLTVDEEIYRLAPAFVIATVDKFARLAREGEAASLFGYVGRALRPARLRAPRLRGLQHHDRAPRQPNGHPAATVHPVGRLRPPDLIIQDELHLITGALGTTVGLFEVAIDALCLLATPPDGTPVRPLIVASTATVRNAADQVRALYGRDVTIFPPQVLDVGRHLLLPGDAGHAGSTRAGGTSGSAPQGVRLTSAEIRVSEVLLAAGQLLFDRGGVAADPYMTLVGYFSATRELAGMARYMGDDVQNRGQAAPQGLRLPAATRHRLRAAQHRRAHLADRLRGHRPDAGPDGGLEFDPDFDTTEAFKRGMAAQTRGQEGRRRASEPPVRRGAGHLDAAGRRGRATGSA